MISLSPSASARSFSALVQVGANTGVISQASIPFGGVKESGFGREGASLDLPLPPIGSRTLPDDDLRDLVRLYVANAGSKYGLQDWQQIKLIAIGGL